MKKSLRRKKTKKMKLRRSDLLFFAVCIVVFAGFFCTVIAQERTLADIREEKAAGEKELAGINNTAELQRLGRELAAEKYIAYLNGQTSVKQNQEADDVDESSAEGEAEYDADTIARNVIAGIEGGILTNIKSYDDFVRYLINNGVSISDATKLRDEWESIHPYLFTDTSAMELNANKVTGGKALAGPPVHTLK
jgi:hypothetical protein